MARIRGAVACWAILVGAVAHGVRWLLGGVRGAVAWGRWVGGRRGLGGRGRWLSEREGEVLRVTLREGSQN